MPEGTHEKTKSEDKIILTFIILYRLERLILENTHIGVFVHSRFDKFLDGQLAEFLERFLNGQFNRLICLVPVRVRSSKRFLDDPVNEVQLIHVFSRELQGLSRLFLVFPAPPKYG